jgi:hypothetical protein
MKSFLRSLLLTAFIPSIVFGAVQVCPRMPVQAAVSNNFLTAISAAGTVTTAQPAFTNLSGSVAASQMPALTGDVTTSAGAVATTLATVNSNVGSFGSATQVGTFTVNAKGLITAASNTTITATVVTAPPTVQKFTSGSTYNKNYTFVITSGSATVGATYTNNGVTYTVWATVASATQVVMNGSGAPAASGTLTKASGTGDSTLTFSQVLAPLYIEVEAVGPGGGGAGSSTSQSDSHSGTAGSGATTFGTGGSQISAGAGSGGGSIAGNSGGGAGGTSSLGTGNIGIANTGNYGGSGSLGVTSSSFPVAPSGGAGPFGGSGPGGPVNQAPANNPAANSGSGGGAGGAPSAGNSGGAGGAGGYVRAIISSPGASYSISVGTGGTFGSAGTSGQAGRAGADGIIIVTEHYQ